jgi:hypothetical protein
MGGIIMGALGGAGEQMVNIAATQMKSDLDTERESKLASLRSDLELQRQKALEDFKVTQANQQREAQAGRISTAAEGIVNSKLGQKYAGSDAAVAAADAGQTDAPLTDEQRGVIAQAKRQDRDALMNDPKIRTQAGIQTGDIAPTEAAKLASASEISQMKMDSLLQRAEDRNATMKEVADVRAEALKYGYDLRLQAAQEKRINGKIDTATTRMLITSEDANIRAATSQLGMLNTQLAAMPPTKGGKPNPDYDGVKTQMDSLRSDIAESKQRKLDLFKGLNIVPKDEEGGDNSPSPAPAPAAPKPAASANKPPLASFLK